MFNNNFRRRLRTFVRQFEAHTILTVKATLQYKTIRL